MNWSRLKKQLIWAVGTSMDEEAPYSDLVKLIAGQAYYYVHEEVRELSLLSLEGEGDTSSIAIDRYAGFQKEMEFDDSLNEHSCDEPFPAYTLGRDPNSLDVIHRD